MQDLNLPNLFRAAYTALANLGKRRATMIFPTEELEQWREALSHTRFFRDNAKGKPMDFPCEVGLDRFAFEIDHSADVAPGHVILDFA